MISPSTSDVYAIESVQTDNEAKINYESKFGRNCGQIGFIFVICLLLAILTILLCLYFLLYSSDDNQSAQSLRDYANYSLGACSTYKCGTNVVHSKTLRIIGGQTVTPYTWPWQGALMRRQNGFGFYLICGATLISNQWILTAAHCFQQDQNPDNYIIKLGAFNVNSNDEAGEMVLKIASINVHPKFNSQVLFNDIAVLKLQFSIQCNDHIVPICLPKQSEPLPSVGSMLTLTGWGTTQAGIGTTSSTLRQVSVPLLGQLICKTAYDGNVNYNYNFCAGYKDGGMDACQGDSGGPAVYRSNDQNPWVQLGITSWGDGCGKASKPGVYTRVSSHMDWIEQYTTINHP